MPKKVLVTGSEGFIGRHLVPKLVSAEYEVCRCDKTLGGNQSIECLPDSYHGKTQWDVIVHLAANIAPIDERIQGTVSCYNDITLDMQMAKYVEENPPRELFLYPSSCAVDNPSDPYAWVKLTGERLCRALARQGVPVTILRPFSGYGADQAETYPFPAILGRALRNERPLRVWGSGAQVRDWVHVEDLTDAFMAAIAHAPCGGNPVEIGTGRGTSLRNVAEMIAREVNPRSPAPVMPDSSKPESSWERIARPMFAVREWDWRPKISLQEGIRMAVAEKMNLVAAAT